MRKLILSMCFILLGFSVKAAPPGFGPGHGQGSGFGAKCLMQASHYDLLNELDRRLSGLSSPLPVISPPAEETIIMAAACRGDSFNATFTTLETGEAREVKTDVWDCPSLAEQLTNKVSGNITKSFLFAICVKNPGESNVRKYYWDSALKKIRQISESQFSYDHSSCIRAAMAVNDPIKF